MLTESFRESASEILRRASVALGGRPVTLWEVADGPTMIPQATSEPHPRHHLTSIDFDTTLKRWGVPVAKGSRWVGCRFNYEGPWLIAPVRANTPVPPPDGKERRTPERLTLELAGLCLGLVDRREERAPRPAGAGDPVYDFLTLPAVIAHEAKNPLAAARACLQLSMDTVRRIPDVSEERRSELMTELSEVSEALERALDFLQAVQDRSRGARRAGPARFDAVRVARSVAALEGRALRHHGVELDVLTDVESVHLNGDPGLLFELLLNLVKNAADAMAGRPGPITVRLARQGDSLRITVRDRGVGIPPHLLEKVFEEGFTTKQDGEGIGAGLAIVQRIAQSAFDGTVSVASKVNEGTTFAVSLPIPPQRGTSPGPTQPAS